MSLNINKDTFRALAAGYVDNELTESERAEFEKLLKENPELRNEIQVFERIKTMTTQVRFEELPDPLWEAFRASLYRRTESIIGWVLFSLGAIMVVLFGGWQIMNEFFLNPEEPILARVAVGTLLSGAAVILVSTLRETLFHRKRDRYAKVIK